MESNDFNANYSTGRSANVYSTVTQNIPDPVYKEQTSELQQLVIYIQLN